VDEIDIQAETQLWFSTLSHPDYTVGSGLSPNPPPTRVAGLARRGEPYRRSGITPPGAELTLP